MIHMLAMHTNVARSVQVAQAMVFYVQWVTLMMK